MNVAILGTGYVGLVSGVCLAARGHRVTCFDINPTVVDRLNRGEAHIYERGLGDLLSTFVREGRFRAAPVDVAALAGHPLVLIAVGTPSVEGRIDLQHVAAAARTVALYLRSSRQSISVVVKSTVVPGTTDTFVREIIDRDIAGIRVDYGLGMNPEFLREGAAVEDFMEPDRIVLGHEDPMTLARLRELYEPWSCMKLEVNSRTAEMIKYVNNCLLATQISAINELTNVARAVGGIDIHAVLEGLHSDRRWNPAAADGTRTDPGILRYLIPGVGFGGSCFPKDLQAMRTLGQALAVPMQLLQAVLDVNERQPAEVMHILEEELGSLPGKRVLVLGLAFKPGTDDVRESPAIRLIKVLLQRRVDVVAHDPMARETGRRALEGLPVTLVDDWQSQLSRCEAAVVATAWPDYVALSEEPQRRSLAGRLLVDTRFLLSAAQFAGVVYRTVGGAGRGRDQRDGELARRQLAERA